MINHFRTLLLNHGGVYIPITDRLSDIYIPEYTIKNLPTAMQSLRHVLFGDCATDADEVTKAFLLLKAVHLSDLKAHILDKDSRLTYDMSQDQALKEFLIDQTLTFSLERISEMGESTIEFTLGGAPDLIRQFTGGKTFIDRLAAITVGYVDRMEELK